MKYINKIILIENLSNMTITAMEKIYKTYVCVMIKRTFDQ